MSGRQSSDEVAHEAEDNRAHLASTLEQLRTNLQPENVMEEVVINARAGAASVADNLAGLAKQHPIPSVLVAAGSALIMRLFSKRGAERASGGTPGPAAPQPDYVRVGMPRPSALNDASGFRPAPGRGGSALAAVPGEGGTLSASLRRRAERAYEATSAEATEAMQKVSRYLPSDRGEAKSKLATLFEEQPLVLGAIGLAVGAAIGAALPMTETEDHLLGPTSHRFRDQATDAARQEVDEMRSAASEAVGNVRQSAQDNLRTVMNKAGNSLEPETRDV